jgi:hypothetical protein
MNAEVEPTLSRRGLVKYETNPFLPDAAANTNEGTKRKTLRSKDGSQLMITSQSGETLAPAGFWHTQEVDKTQFVKLYVNGVKAFAGLSGAGAQVFGLVYAELQKAPGKDIIHLNFPDVKQDITPISKATFMRGVKEILLKKFLAETLVSGRYFVNPDYIFNGDRLAIVKEFRLKRDAVSDQAWREQLDQNGQQRLEAIDPDPETGGILQ